MSLLIKCYLNPMVFRGAAYIRRALTHPCWSCMKDMYKMYIYDWR